MLEWNDVKREKNAPQNLLILIRNSEKKSQTPKFSVFQRETMNIKKPKFWKSVWPWYRVFY